MKKILILSLLLTFLASCSLWKKETDFTRLYKDNVIASLKSLDEFSQTIWYKRQESIQGTIKSALQIPILMSWAFLSDYNIEINNSDMNALLSSMKMNFETPINSGSLSTKRLGLMSITGDMYMLMEDFIDVWVFPIEAHDIFAKYNNIWLSYTQQDMDKALSGATADEIMISTIAKNVSQIDIRWPWGILHRVSNLEINRWSWYEWRTTEVCYWYG